MLSAKPQELLALQYTSPSMQAFAVKLLGTCYLCSVPVIACTAQRLDIHKAQCVHGDAGRSLFDSLPRLNEPMRLPLRKTTVWGQPLHPLLCMMRRLSPSHGRHMHLANTGDPIPTLAQHGDPLNHLLSTPTQPLPQQGPRYIEQCEVVLPKDSRDCIKQGSLRS